MSSNLSKIEISSEEKEALEELSGQKVYTRNSFGTNKDAVAGLLEQARVNALVYLERNKLGQRLSLFEENNLFASLVELQKKLALNSIPRRVECYDISHISGKFVYGSMVVFVDGKPSKKFYRLFKTKEQNNDFANLKEVLLRRLGRALDFATQKGVEKFADSAWKLPDLIIIDGGKGQLGSVLQVLNEIKKGFVDAGLDFQTELCSLAKNEERVFFVDGEGGFGSCLLTGQAKFLIQRVRDEAHRFAITNSRKARLKVVSKSQLDDIAGVGEKTKTKLLTTFGSVDALVDQLWKDESLVAEAVGKSLVAKLKEYFGVRR